MTLDEGCVYRLYRIVLVVRIRRKSLLSDRFRLSFDYELNPRSDVGRYLLSRWTIIF